jgi:hypothetical protein
LATRDQAWGGPHADLDDRLQLVRPKRYDCPAAERRRPNSKSALVFREG